MPPLHRSIALFALASALAAPAWGTPRCEGRLPMSEVEQRQERTLALLREKRFDELQKRADGFLADYAARRIDDEELFYEFGAFDRWGPFLTPLLQEWLERQPKSFAAHHAMALHLASRAWQARGSALARDTSDAQMAAFERDLREARKLSLRSLKLHPKPILAYQQLVNHAKALRADDGSLLATIGLVVAAAQGSLRDPRPDVQTWMREAERVQPDNVIVRQAYIGLLAPRWGGSLDALQDYARPARHPGLAADRLASVSYSATMEIASDYAFRQQPDDAVAVYEVAAQICRLNQPHISIANLRLEQKRYAEALAAADAALALVPSSASGTQLRIRALRGLGRVDEADALARERGAAPAGASR